MSQPIPQSPTTNPAAVPTTVAPGTPAPTPPQIQVQLPIPVNQPPTSTPVFQGDISTFLVLVALTVLVKLLTEKSSSN